MRWCNRLARSGHQRKRQRALSPSESQIQNLDSRQIVELSIRESFDHSFHQGPFLERVRTSTMKTAQGNVPSNHKQANEAILSVVLKCASSFHHP